jgi:hypothetical protein
MGPIRYLAIAALFVVACGSAATNQAQTLSFAYTKGAQHTYKLQMSLDEVADLGGITQPIKFDMTATEKETVQSVDSNGVADLRIEMSDVSFKSTVNGQTTTSTTTVPASEIKVGADGHVQSVNGLSFSGGSPFGAVGSSGTNTAIFPDHPVKPGDSWTKDYDQTNPFGTGTVHISSSSKYLRDEAVNGTQAAVVQSNVTTPMDMTIDFAKLSQLSGQQTTIPIAGLTGMSIKGNQVGDVTTWLDAKGHRMLKTKTSNKIDAQFSFVMSPGQTFPGPQGPYSIKGTQTMDITAA